MRDRWRLHGPDSVARLDPGHTPPSTLTPAQEQALGTRYAPILYFHPQEQNFLRDPLTYLDQSTLRQERDFWGGKELRGLGDVPPEELAGIDAGNEDADGQVSVVASPHCVVIPSEARDLLHAAVPAGPSLRSGRHRRG